MTPSLPDSTVYALRADITVHEEGVEYRGGKIIYRVDIDDAGKYRCVLGKATLGDETVGRQCSGVKLRPSRIQRWRESLTGYEYEPVSEMDHVATILERLQRSIDRVVDAREGHEQSCDLTVEVVEK